MRTSAGGQSVLLLLDVIDVLNQKRIPYAVIGALAVSYYGFVRASLDADAVISFDSGKPGINDLKATLNQSGLKVIVKRGSPDDPLAGVMLIEDRHGNQVDLILGIRGMDTQAFERTRQGTLQGETMNIIGPEDLVAMKVFAGGTKDISDVQGILDVSSDRIDRPLLKKLIVKYGRQAEDTLDSLLAN